MGGAWRFGRRSSRTRGDEGYPGFIGLYRGLRPPGLPRPEVAFLSTPPDLPTVSPTAVGAGSLGVDARRTSSGTGISWRPNEVAYRGS